MVALAAAGLASQAGIADAGDLARFLSFATGSVREGFREGGPGPIVALFVAPFHALGALAEARAGALGLAVPSDPTAGAGPLGQYSLVASACAIAASTLFVHLIALELGCRPFSAAIGAGLFAFATLAFPQTGRITSAPFSTLIVLAFFYAYLRVRAGWDRPAHLALLALALFAAPLVSLEMALATPILYFLAAIQGPLLAKRSRAGLLVAGAALSGLALLIATAPGGAGELVAQAGARMDRFSGSAALRLLFMGAHPSAWFEAATSLPPSLAAKRAPGLLLSTPFLVFALFGILNLRAEGLLRRPLYALLLLLTALFAIAAAAPVAETGRGAEDVARLLPFIALACVLVASFVDFHLLTMRSTLLKLPLLLAFVYAAALSVHHQFATIVQRTLAHPDVFRTLPLSPLPVDAASPGASRIVSLIFPALGNLPWLLPPAIVALALPLFARRWLDRRPIATERAARAASDEPPRRDPRDLPQRVWRADRPVRRIPERAQYEKLLARDAKRLGVDIDPPHNRRAADRVDQDESPDDGDPARAGAASARESDEDELLDRWTRLGDSDK